MKEYFSHDYNARNDTKLVKLFMKYKLEGIGAYWCIIEMLYEEGGYLLRSEYERIAFELRTEKSVIKSIIEDFELFQKDAKKFWSITALERLNKRIEKSEKARESVQKRWKKYERNTNVKQLKNDGNTSKVKESKGKESKVNSKFDLTFSEFEKMRNKIKKPLTEKAKELILNKLEKMSSNEENKIKILEQSIENSWQGVFPLKNSTNTNSKMVY